MSQSVDAIAERLRSAAVQSPEAYTDCLASLWAPTVVSAHEPPAEKLDGPRPGERQVEMHRKEDGVFRGLMPDYRQEDVAVTVDGNRIALSATIAGTLPKGDKIALPVRWVFTVEDGKIPHSLTVVDMAVAAPFLKLLNEARVLPV